MGKNEVKKSTAKMPQRSLPSGQVNKKKVDKEKKSKVRIVRKDSIEMNDLDLNENFQIPKSLDVEENDLALFAQLEQGASEFETKMIKAEQKVKLMHPEKDPEIIAVYSK